MDRDERGPHLRACPVCHATMVGEKSEPDVPLPDVYRCLSCGAIIEHLPRPPDRSGDGKGGPKMGEDRGEAPAGPI